MLRRNDVSRVLRIFPSCHRLTAANHIGGASTSASAAAVFLEFERRLMAQSH